MATQTQAAPAVMRPFLTGTHGQETHIYDNTVTMTTGTVNLPLYQVVTDGFLRGFYLYVQCTTASNAATVAFTEDAPWSALTNITFQDVNQRPIIGPLSGWELKTAIKFGGYTFHDDAQDSVTYSVTTGAGGTGGSFSWMLHIPIEFVKRNAIGALTNINAAAVYSVKMDAAPSTDTYSTSPTTLGSLRVRIQQESWMESAGQDPKGRAAAPNPVAVDTQQYWVPQRYQSLASGSMNLELNQIDGYVRNLVFVWEDTSSSRLQGELNAPDPMRFKYDNVYIADRLKDVWRREVEENYGYTGARPTTLANTSAAVGANQSFKDNGVFPLAYNDDFGQKNGGEQGYNYLYVSTGTRLTLEGSIQNGSSNLTVLVNYIRPAGGDITKLTGGK